MGAGHHRCGPCRSGLPSEDGAVFCLSACGILPLTRRMAARGKPPAVPRTYRFRVTVLALDILWIAACLAGAALTALLPKGFAGAAWSVLPARDSRNTLAPHRAVAAAVCPRAVQTCDLPRVVRAHAARAEPALRPAVEPRSLRRIPPDGKRTPLRSADRRGVPQPIQRGRRPGCRDDGRLRLPALARHLEPETMRRISDTGISPKDFRSMADTFWHHLDGRKAYLTEIRPMETEEEPAGKHPLTMRRR